MLCSVFKGKLYGDVEFVEERHRHRYEVNPELVSQFEERGLQFVGQDVDGDRMEIMELKGTVQIMQVYISEKSRSEFDIYLRCIIFYTPCHYFPSTDHPYYVAVQYHPEYISRPMKPSPPYLGLLLAACGKLPSYLAKGCRISPFPDYTDSDFSPSEDEEITRELASLNVQQLKP